MKKRLLILLLILLIIVIVLNGCISLEGVKKKREALKYLEETYNKEFVIKKVRYISANKVWEMTAAPKDDKRLEFMVRTGGMFGKRFISDYVKTRLTLLSRNYYKPILKDIFGRHIFFYSNVGTHAKFETDKIPTFKKVMERKPEKTYINMYIFIFKDVITKEKRKKVFLSNVMELLEYLRGQDLKWATIQIDIFDEKFFKDKDIDFIIEETNYFHTGSPKLKYSAAEYKKKTRYNLLVLERHYKKIKNKKNLEKLINTVYPK